MQHARAKDGFDLVVCQADMPGFSGVQAVRELRSAGSAVRVVFLARDDTFALDAVRLGAAGYLMFPWGQAEARAVLGAALATAVADDQAAVALKARDGAYRVRFRDFDFAESRDHDQLVHLSSAIVLTCRISSTQLFARLQHDARFMKLGSSYIVNMDNMESLRGGVAYFASGASLVVPARSVKPLERAFLALAGA